MSSKYPGICQTKEGEVMFDLATAVVPKTPYMTVFEKKTVDVFCEELAGRSGVDLRGNAVSAEADTIEFYNEGNPGGYGEKVLELLRDIPEEGKDGFRCVAISWDFGIRTIPTAPGL